MLQFELVFIYMHELEARLNLVCKNTVEVLTKPELTSKLEQKRQLSAYYGTAPTGPVHIGYLVPATKIFDFREAGINTMIMFADVHAALDDQKSKWDELDKKVAYYQKCWELSFDWGDEKPKFIRGSDIEYDKDYINDVFRLASTTTISRATRAASEVTRMKEPKVSELIYPIMQSLDEQYLDVDIQIGGTDQRHIFAFARECLPTLGYERRIEVMTQIMVSLQKSGSKMSASMPESHIKVYEPEESILKKIRNAYAPVGIVEGNALLQIARFLVFSSGNNIKVKRDQKFGGDIEFSSYDELERAYTSEKLHPADLKECIAKNLIDKFKRVRTYFESHRDILEDLGPAFLP